MIIYKKDQVLDETLHFFKGDTLAADVWMSKYALKNKNGEFLESNPQQMFNRITEELYRIEQKYPNPISKEVIYDLISSFTIIPGGSVLFGVGNNHQLTSLANCFVIGNNEDSYGSIMKIDEEQIQLMKRRGGVGHDLSHLRSKGSAVDNAAHTSTGAVSFMERYSNSTREVAQGGRRGALLLSLDVDHPDIIDFITSKSDLTKITGANISIKITDAFMYKVVHEDPEALKIWKLIIKQAMATGEPGVLFIDTIHNNSPAASYGKDWKEISVNPCGEIPLCPYDSCRLLSINLSKFVNNPFTEKASFNNSYYKKVIKIAQRLMDDIVDLEEEKINRIIEKIKNDPEPENLKSTELSLWYKILDKLIKGRRTGLSAIGFADTAAMLGIKYIESHDLAWNIYSILAENAYYSSSILAEERGTFPLFNADLEKDNKFLMRLGVQGVPRRNISLLTIPPSGTLSILAGVSSGIEPVFNLFYKRRRKVEKNHYKIDFVDQSGDCWEEYAVLHSKFAEWCYYKNPNNTPEFLSTLSFEDLSKIASVSPYAEQTANDINPLEKIKLLSIIQNNIDHAISNTTNLPKTVSFETVETIYMNSWELGLKGCTIYVEGSRSGVLINKETSKKEDKFEYRDAPKRPKDLNCDIYQIKFPNNGTYVVIVGLLDNKPYEVFTFEFKDEFGLKKGIIRKVSKGRYDILTLEGETYSEDITSSMEQVEEDFTRLISTSLRHGADIKFIIEQINKTSSTVVSFKKSLARVLKKYIPDNTKVKSICPQCGGELVYQEGCISCTSCSYSKCN